MTDERAQFVVPRDHPALSGHFPGRPIVPGVVVLEWALTRVAAGRQLARVVSAKFLATLKPEEHCEVSWRDATTTTTIECRVGGGLIAEFHVCWTTPAAQS